MAKRKKTGGRQKGSGNKLPQELKVMILEALDKAGGIDYLVDKSKSHPTAFLSLIGKVLPMTVIGDEDNPFLIKDISSKPFELESATWLTQQDKDDSLEGEVIN